MLHWTFKVFLVGVSHKHLSIVLNYIIGWGVCKKLQKVTFIVLVSSSSIELRRHRLPTSQRNCDTYSR